jgi:hypothetical protein
MPPALCITHYQWIEKKKIVDDSLDKWEQLQRRGNRVRLKAVVGQNSIYSKNLE